MPGAVITKQEEGTLLMLFNRSGYVLNFSTNDFDVFTTNSIGEALCLSLIHISEPTRH